jgi:CRISPR/Cas system-associated endonuclease Cas1
MTTPFMHRALRDGIDVILLDEHGGPGGRLTSLAHSDPAARRAQYNPCLALDLMEEFRPVVVDAVVLRCLSTGIVRFEEFETSPDLGCRMSARARQAFLTAYERRMLTVFTHEPTARRVSYRVGISLQAKALARAILDPDRVYRPVRWK